MAFISSDDVVTESAKIYSTYNNWPRPENSPWHPSSLATAIAVATAVILITDESLVRAIAAKRTRTCDDGNLGPC